MLNAILGGISTAILDGVLKGYVGRYFRGYKASLQAIFKRVF